MKTKIIIALLVAASLSAQEQTGDSDTQSSTATPDYSRPSLQRFVLSIPEPPKRDRNVRFHVGAVEFGAIGTRWRFNYLPIMAPLSGTRLAVTREWPDPFSLTGTAIATPKRAWRTQRNVNAEMRRIEQSERAKIRVHVSGK
ncbi:MAG TPA: hypothetical protein VNI54_16230 [Thermoanaerobaculia bacterium]|nr:hypothetical protein [Thermoanaerobaculia bacterium]